jgi:hypothetical protein
MNGWIEHFQEGGWGMYPTTIFGLALLFVAMKYAMAPEKRWVPLLTGLSALTLTSGGLGFVTGLITTCKAIGSERFAGVADTHIALEGFGESLNDLAFALLFLVVAALAGSYGAWRLARTPVAQEAQA